MEPLPLIPRNRITVTREMGCLVRETFQNAFQTETATTWQMSMNLLKSCEQNSELREIATQIQADIIDHKEKLDDIEYAEMQVMKSHGYYLCRDQKITSNERAFEMIKLKRHPLFIDLHPNITEKYPLLQSDDLLPPIHECATDFRLDEKERLRMKKHLYKSRDSLLDDIPLPEIVSRNCKFGAIVEQKWRKVKTRKRSPNSRMAPVDKRSIIRPEYAKAVLIAQPEELFFHNFEYNKLYKKTVLIKNVSCYTARYKIEKRSPNSKFTVLFDSATVVTQKIAPGMHVKLTVLFKCDVIEDPEEFLIVNVRSGKTVCIKMYGYRDPPLLRGISSVLTQRLKAVRTSCLTESGSQSLNMDMEVVKSSSTFLSISEGKGGYEIHEEQLIGTLKNIKKYGEAGLLGRSNANLGANFECGRCFVGERIILSRKFVNDGGDGKFFIMSEIDWCTMSIDDIMDCNMILIPPFAIWPAYFALKSGQCIDIRTYFCPELYGMQVDKLYILCDNHAIHPIELMGDGILFDANFLCFGENIEKNEYSDYENNDERVADYQLNMGVNDSRETLQNHFSIENTGELEMSYRWEKRSAKHVISNSRSGWSHLPIENLYIESDKGFLNSDATTSFKVITKTENLEPDEYCAILRLFIEDIPLAAIPKDCDLAISECYTKRRNCPITVDVLLTEIEVRVRCIPKKESPIADIFGETSKNKNSDGWILNETGEQNVITTNDPCSSLNSTADVQNPYDTSTCRMNGVKCIEDYTSMKDSENLWNAILTVKGNSEVDTSAPVIPRLDFHYQKTNTAILVPDRPLYLGIKQAYTLKLQNMICKSVSYAWGQPTKKKQCIMEVNFNPDKGLILPLSNAVIEVVCSPANTGKLDDFYVPCFIGGQEDPVMLGIECSIEALYVTFIFLPKINDSRSRCVDSVRVEWHKDVHKSALDLNNLQINRNSIVEAEQELKNIDLDAGQVVATAAVGPTPSEIDNSLSVSLSEIPFPTQQISHNKSKKTSTRTEKKLIEKTKMKNSSRVESESKEVEQSELRSWESLLKGIIWTAEKPDEFISLSKPLPVVPFYKTIVPPVMQALAIEFINLPLRTMEKRTFVIRNETPAVSSFSITLKQFGPVKKVKELKPKDIINITYAAAMGHDSDDYWEKVKPPGQGVVLVIEPSNGNFGSHETIPVDIYAYADTWGVYVDEITIAVAGLPDYIIGVCIQVVGSPIEYPICKTGTNKTPVLRFGTVDPDTEKVTRKIQIENTSSVTLFVNWYSYLIGPKYVENSVPFDINLLMFSPITNKVSDVMCTGSTNGHEFEKISTGGSTTEESLRSEPVFDVFDSLNCSSLAVCCPSESAQVQITQTSTPDSTPEKNYSNALTTGDQILSQKEESEAKTSIDGDNLNGESIKCNGESETGTVAWSEQTIDKETEAELAVTAYHGKLDNFIFTVVPAEVIVPAKEKRWIEVALNTVECCMDSGETEICAHLMGFVRVAPVHRYKADCYSRVDGALLTPTEIKLEARIAKATFSQEIADSDRTSKTFEN